MTKVTLTLYRGLNGTNPSAFRVDEDGVSVFEKPLPDYKFNLPIRARYEGKKNFRHNRRNYRADAGKRNCRIHTAIWDGSLVFAFSRYGNARCKKSTVKIRKICA